ncbi:serine/threonine-protein kinase [Tuwongella immobilis]|nr:serine/threonine-protein kinase [Tuwongella immobilis]
MSIDSQVQRLLRRWVEATTQGQTLTIPALCADCPELIPAVEREILRYLQTLTEQDNVLGNRLTKSFLIGSLSRNPTAAMSVALSMPTTSPNMGTPDRLSLGGYPLRDVLGQGGMGCVYLAEDERLKRPIAIKVMHAQLAAVPEARARFLREAQAVAQLEHDHIITIHQVGEDGEIPFLVMPYLRGESLESRLRSANRLPPLECVRIAREIAEGLAHAHDRQLIHRDIKPANIWLESERNRVKILDFGLARPGNLNDRLTSEKTILGTPAYMSPEQANGDEVDGRADLFSLGCVLYEMLTGVQPFDGPTVYAILSALSQRTPERVDRLVPQIPRSLADLVEQLLQKSPAARPKSAAEVVEALRAIEASAPSSGTTPLRSRRSSKRKAIVIGSLIGILALLIIGLLTLGGPRPEMGTSPPQPPTPTPTPTPEPPAIPQTDRAIANRLLEYVASLNIRTASGKNQEIFAGNVLPDEAFRIIGINQLTPAALPAGFLGETFLPTIEPLPELEVIRNTATRLKVDDLPPERLLKLRSFDTITGLGVQIPWTPIWIDTLRKFPKLIHLQISGTSDFATLAPRLREFPVIKTMVMYDFGPADSPGWKVIPTLNCSYLHLSRSAISAEHWANLLKNPTLESLIVSMGPLTDAHFQALATHGNLTMLALERFSGNLTAANVAALAGMRRVQILSIDHPQFDEDKLMQLVACQSLMSLRITNTRVTRRGVEAFLQQRPNCQVEWNGQRIRKKPT